MSNKIVFEDSGKYGGGMRKNGSKILFDTACGV